MHTKNFEFQPNATNNTWFMLVQGTMTDWHIKMHNTFNRSCYVVEIEHRKTFHKSLCSAKTHLISEYIEYTQDD